MSFANKIVYIAGPITGRLDSYQSDFKRAVEIVEDMGGIALNPAVLPLGMKSHESYMRICLPMLREADELVLLPGWKDSKGALQEAAEANRIGMPIHEFVLVHGMTIGLVPLPPAPANDNVPASEREDDLSEPAVTERLTEAAQTVLAAAPALMDEKFRFDPVSTAQADTLAKTLCSLLKADAWGFDSNALAELHQLCDAELTKRDAAVCGGQKYLDAHWFERGELPPVGIECEALITSERLWVEIEVVCHRDGFALGWCPKERCGYHGDEPTDFRPIRTDLDRAATNV